MKDTKIITALDIGTSKVFAIIAKINEDNKLEVIGSASSPNKGMDKGIVKDIEKATESIKTAITQAEEAAATEVDNIYVSISGEHIKSINAEGRTSVSGANDNVLVEVKKEHTEMAKNDACNLIRSRPAFKNTEIIHAIPRSYDIDNEKNIINPINMCGYQLTSYVHVVLAELATIRNIARCLELAGCREYHFVLSQIASARAVLNEDEVNLGSVLLDIGAGTVDIIAYEQSAISYTSVLPLGGNNLTLDISMGLMTSLKCAENLKIEHGNVCPELVEDDMSIDVEGIADRPSEKKKAKLLSVIMHHRASEILDCAYNCVKSNTHMQKLTGGLILTGGSAHLVNFEKLAKEEFNMPVRIASPDLSLLTGAVFRLKDPKFSTSVGLLYYGYDNVMSRNSVKHKLRKTNFFGNFKNVVKKIIDGLSDFF